MQQAEFKNKAKYLVIIIGKCILKALLILETESKCLKTCKKNFGMNRKHKLKK
jgi:hypothetical protein